MLNYKEKKKTACWMIAVEGIICIICIILVVCFFTNGMKREEPSTSAVQAGNEDSGKMMQHTIENLENNGTDTAALDLSGSWILDESYTVQSNNGIELQAIIGSTPTNSPSTLLLKADGVIEFTLGGYKGEGRWQPDGDTGRYVADVLLSNDGGNVSLPLYTFRESPDSTLYLVLDYGDAVLFWSKMNQKSDIDTLNLIGSWILDESYTVQSNNGIELQAIIGSSPTNSPSTLLLKPDGVIEFTLGGYKGEGRWQPDGDTGRYVADVLLSNDGGNVSLLLYTSRESPDSTLYLVLHYGDAVLLWSKMNQKSDIDTLNLSGSWILDESYTVQSNNGIELQAIIGKSSTNSPSTLLLKADGVIEFTLGGYKGEGRWQPDGDTGRYVADVLLSNDGGNVSLPLYDFRESPDSTLYLVLKYSNTLFFWTKE